MGFVGARSLQDDDAFVSPRDGVIALVADLAIRVLSDEGELLRRLTLDTQRDYRPITP